MRKLPYSDIAQRRSAINHWRNATSPNEATEINYGSPNCLKCNQIVFIRFELTLISKLFLMRLLIMQSIGRGTPQTITRRRNALCDRHKPHLKSDSFILNRSVNNWIPSIRIRKAVDCDSNVMHKFKHRTVRCSRRRINWLDNNNAWYTTRMMSVDSQLISNMLMFPTCNIAHETREITSWWTHADELFIVFTIFVCFSSSL